MKAKHIIIFVLLIAGFIFPQDSSQTFLSVTNTGVAEFHSLYPEYDGRGTIIFVLDTGVDPGIDGLTKTSTGETKVIDMQDFTGEGDVKLYEAEIDEEDNKQYFINEDMNYKVSGSDKLTYQSVDNTYYIGVFEEKSLINSSSGSADLNGNGSTDDSYAIVVFKTMAEEDQFWVAYFDTDGDGDVSDEFPLQDYKINQQSFTIKTSDGLPPLTFGLNIFPEKKIVSIHFDDGAHGTHVAGIASGNNIGGTDLSGVAPGAFVISCKLGNNNFSGGATVTESMKKAYLYADKISKERKEPCIINMSFGIGSEIEGRSEIAKFLEELVKQNPYLYISTSNGNEGPGISSTGLPSASEFVFSSGAVLPMEVGRDLYGADIDRDIVLYFSSRGGEVNKPDVVSPGASTSTVPNWETGDRYWGTSMAAPYTAGVFSLLLSAITSEYPDVKVPAPLVYRAVKEAAKKLDGYTYVDQGAGYINVVGAYKLLKKYIDNGEIKKLETYSITSTAPNMPDGKAPSLYLRDGSFITGAEKFNFIIRRNNFQNSNKFYRAYKLSCSEDWVKLVKKKTYIRNDQSAVVTIKFDKEKMKLPGLYSARIKAYRDDGSQMPEFEMLATVVIPYQFTPENNYEQTWTDMQINNGEVHRYFITVPSNQTSMNVLLYRDDSEYAMTRYIIYDPDGREMSGSPLLYSVDNDEVISKYYYNLHPGIYEVDIDGYFRADKSSNYNLKIKFHSIKNISGNTISADNNTITIINEINCREKYDMFGKIIGYEKNYKVNLKSYDRYNLPFTLYSGEASKEFELKLTKKDFNKLTDFAFMIKDADGVALENEALSFKEGTISIRNNTDADSTNYILELVPGFANADDEMKIIITEKTEFNQPGNLNVTFAGSNSITLYPNIPASIECNFDKPYQVVPPDAKIYGAVYFQSQSNGDIVQELPIYLQY